MATALYTVCLILESVPFFVRFYLAFAIAVVSGQATDLAAAAILTFACLPLLFANFTYSIPLPGGWGLYWELGARRPSQREKDIVKPALRRLKERGARAPLVWFVIDDPVPNALTVGCTVYIHSSLIGHPAMEAVLAHECGHMATPAGDLLLALLRLEFPGLRMLRVYLEEMGYVIPARAIRLISGGGSSELPIVRSLIGAYLRHDELRADRYAKKLGYGPELAEFLDANERPLDVATPFRMGRTHPYTETRIETLLQFR